jgi:uncharacterized protein
MRPVISSAVYEGIVTHRRHAPHAHTFSYRLVQLYLDLDEIDVVFRNRWLWSVNRRNLAEWRRADYLGPRNIPLARAVRQRIASETGHAPTGPIRLLTHLRYAGYIFNPVSFYYCYGDDSTTLECIVAEITNTPWRERHAYVLPVASATSKGRRLAWGFDKTFHVSPFMPMERSYEWSFTPPGCNLHVHMRVLDIDRSEFDATLTLKRQRLDGRSLARVLWRYPFMTLRVITAIHWQALRLWLKHNPVHDHPRLRTQPVNLAIPPRDAMNATSTQAGDIQ